MRRNIYLSSLVCAVAIMFSSVAFAQDDDSPVLPAFETITLIDGQTTMNPYKGGLTLAIQHRFSKISDLTDLFGIFGSANTRLGVSYGVTDKIMLGFGTTRAFNLQELEWKYSLLTQTQSRIPVSISYHGNAVIEARDKSNFGLPEEYRFIHKLSYLNELIISRRFGDKVSFQAAPTFVYFNSVPEGYRNANASVNFGGRLQVLGFHSIIFEYDQPLLSAEENVYPNLALGVEIGTSTHSFRVFASNYNSIVRNRSIAFNSNNPMDGEFQFGFNISIRF